ncbi:MAG: PilZ domain-containing protein [Pseudomonadota bacterium]
MGADEGQSLQASPDSSQSGRLKDKRRFRRIPLAIHGRFLDKDGQEHTLLTQDISCAGVHAISSQRPALDEDIVLYLDDLGRIAGRVVRHTPAGFGLVFESTARKRDKIADRLVWLWNKDRLGLEDDRQVKRYVSGGAALIILADGRNLQCRVIDISVTGAGFEAFTQAPFVGESVTVGNLKAEVVQSQGRNFGVRFMGRVAPADAEQQR